MTKFATNGYPCHIVTPEQTSELLEMLASIPDSVQDVSADDRFMCNPWDVFGDVQQPGLIDAVCDTELGSDGDTAGEPAPAAPAAVLGFGLTNAQLREQVEAQQPLDEQQLTIDSNPAPKQRRRTRRHCRPKHVPGRGYRVGAKVSILAKAFGDDWAKEEYGIEKWNTAVLHGVIVSGVDRSVPKKWVVKWAGDDDAYPSLQTELCFGHRDSIAQ